MDVVLRTPHGEAEISLRANDHTCTLADAIMQVTGRTAPPIAFVDGRAVPSATPLDGSGLHAGSTISTDDDRVTPPDNGVIELVQIAGQGAGAARWLAAGDYVVGAGRRVSAPELDLAPVDEPAFVLRVGAHGRVALRPRNGRVRLDGRELPSDHDTEWTSGIVDVRGRAFEIRPRDPGSDTLDTGRLDVAGRFSAAGADGTTTFNRPPRVAAPVPPAPLEAPEEDRAGRDRALRVRAGRVRAARVRRAQSSAMAAFVRTATTQRDLASDTIRAAHPHLATSVRLALDSDPTLWQRRPGDADAFQFPIGLGDADWTPELVLPPNAPADAEPVVAGLGPLHMAPVTVDLLNERGVGLVGDDDFTRALARGMLVGAAVIHGPADVDMVVLTNPERAWAWEWAKWLPHTRVHGDPRLLSTDDQVHAWAVAARAGSEQPSLPPAHLTLVVIDDPKWWRDRTSPVRLLLAESSIPLRFVALTGTPADVPTVCTTVVTLHHDRSVSVEYRTQRRTQHDIVPFLASPDLATAAARALAPLDDPDLPTTAESSLPSSLPSSMGIFTLLGIDRPDASIFASRWSRPAHQPRAMATIGISDRGPVEIDLVADGPHVLIIGATGSGKGELLRNILIGLASNLGPDDINFLLVDSSGRSVFDACARMPHTVGVATDLDEHAADRLLRCLRAELRHREQVLHDAGTSDLLDCQRLAGKPPLPRLVVAVDEFASVSAALAEFVPSLLEIARAGRRLGLHLILATHRAGAVDGAIQDNTNLRIALRVQDDGDSLDAIGATDAASLPRRFPGRAFIRVGTGELIQFQSASSSGVGDSEARPSMEITPFVIGRGLSPMEHRLERAMEPSPATTDTASDLARLVVAMSQAAGELGQSEQRRAYPAPLPAHLVLREFFDEYPGDAVPFGLLDLPDEQHQTPAWWTPGVDGSLLVFGAAGAGTSSLLVTLALGLAERYSPDDVHLYCIDADTDLLAPLVDLPHTGAVITLEEPERIAWLARLLGDEIDRRGARAELSSEPLIVVMIDNLGNLRQVLEDRADLDGTWSELERVVRDGHALGVCALITADRERAVPSWLATQIPARLVMRLGDRFAYAGFGFRSAEVPRFVAGRALRPDDKLEVQIVEPPTALAAAIAELALEPAIDTKPLLLAQLPSSMTIAEITDHSVADEHALAIPIGLDTRTGGYAVAHLPFGENSFVTGVSGSGRSSVLVAIAAGVDTIEPRIPIFAVAPRGGPLTEVETDRPSTPDDVAPWVERIASTSGRRVVLVDDADQLAGPSFERLASLRDSDLIIVVAGANENLRSPDHWTSPLRRFRHGVLLRPAPDDGDLIQVPLGPRLPPFAAHRGYLVNHGEIVPILAAISSTTPTPTTPTPTTPTPGYER